MTDTPTESVIADRVPQPAGVDGRLAAQMRFIIEVDRLKTVLRRSPLVADSRRENDAEHSWHLALMVLVLAEHADEPVDAARTLALVLVHDLVEIYAGDTFVFDADATVSQEEREKAAADRLFRLLPADQAAEFRGWWDEFEAQATPEARFAKAMDHLEPVLLNYYNDGGTWAAPGVTYTKVHNRKAPIGDASASLWTYTEQLLRESAERGWLSAGGDPAKPAS
jgi:putative hydrolase of HD superfamily